MKQSYENYLRKLKKTVKNTEEELKELEPLPGKLFDPKSNMIVDPKNKSIKEIEKEYPEAIFVMSESLYESMIKIVVSGLESFQKQQTEFKQTLKEIEKSPFWENRNKPKNIGDIIELNFNIEKKTYTELSLKHPEIVNLDWDEVFKKYKKETEEIRNKKTREAIEECYPELLKKETSEETKAKTQEEIRELSYRLSQSKIPAYIDREITDLLPFISLPVSSFSRISETELKDGTFIETYEKTIPQGTLKVEYRIPQEDKNIKTLFSNYKASLYLLTIEAAKEQKTLTPLIPIQNIRERLGRYAERKIQDLYKSLMYSFYEIEIDKPGKEYYWRAGVKSLVSEAERRGMGRGSYIRARLNIETNKSLAAIIQHDREIAGVKEENKPLTYLEKADIEDEHIEAFKREKDFLPKGVNYNKIPQGFSRVKWDRTTRGAFSIWSAFHKILETNKKTYGVKLSTLLTRGRDKTYLDLSDKEINSWSTPELAKILDDVLNKLEDLTKITWEMEDESIEKLETPYIKNLTQEKIKSEGLVCIPETFKEIRKLNLEDRPGTLYAKNNPMAGVTFLDLKIYFKRAI